MTFVSLMLGQYNWLQSQAMQAYSSVTFFPHFRFVCPFRDFQTHLIALNKKWGRQEKEALAMLPPFPLLPDRGSDKS